MAKYKGIPALTPIIFVMLFSPEMKDQWLMKELKFDILFDIANRMSKLSNGEKSKVMLKDGS